MLKINAHLEIPDHEIEINAIRAQGSGGQNVNKVSSAIHLRFDVTASSLPQRIKQQIIKTQDQRMNKHGIIIIKAQRFRAQEQNKADAYLRLIELIRRALYKNKIRKQTRPSRRSQITRMERKNKHGRKKILRQKPYRDL